MSTSPQLELNAVLKPFQSCHNAALPLKAVTLFRFHCSAPSEILLKASSTFWLSVVMRAGFRAKYISKLSMNVRAFVRLPLNSGGSPRSPEGVCVAGAAGGSGASPASAISEKCVEGVEDELEELDESGSPGSGFAVSSSEMYSRLGSVVALRPNSLSGLSSGTVVDSVSTGRSLESLNGSSGF